MEIARREPWAQTAAMSVEIYEDFWGRSKWKVRAGAFDYSGYPGYRGIDFVPGTERELRFTHDGCLTAYIDRGSRCLRPITVVRTESVMDKSEPVMDK